MIWFQIGIFVFFSSFVIWISNYNPELHDELSYIFGPQPKKNPNRFLDMTLVFFLLFGCAIMAYFIPTNKVGLTIGSTIGIIIMAIACVSRTEIHN